MKKTGQYFEKAMEHSEVSGQFLIGFVGVILVLFEGTLASWPVFYGAVPLLSLIFIYWMTLYHSKLMPFITIFIMGLLSDILFSSLIGGRATSYMLLALFMNLRVTDPQDDEFLKVWVNFMFAVMAVMLFQLIFFSVINFSIPSLSPMMFQIGMTLILFPIVYVILFAISNVLERIKVFA
ncbi:rod shape-determining protein MreD [Candidatus Puniceispirillum sp.]|uniref:rod shape-determining protein MreD n=1 Tax=Candidatus Puniceispirillum sp. TaxID=2026719 RepID=UPI003F69636D